MFLASDKIKLANQFTQPVAVHVSSVQKHRQGHVLFNVQNRNQVVELIDKPDFAAAKNCNLFIASRINILSVHKHFAPRGAVNAAQCVQKS